MTGLQKVSGQVVSIDHEKRTVLVLSYEEMDGRKCPIQTPLGWNTGMDGKMQKLQPKYFQTFLHVSGNIDDCHYFARPADWPQQQGGKGNWQGGKPRNEKIIVLQSSLKVAADLFQVCTTPDTQNYDDACDLVVQKAIEMTEKIMKAGGAS